MNDQEGRRLDSLSWKREVLDSNVRQQGGRSEGSGFPSSQNWNSLNFRGGVSRGFDSSSANSSSSNNGVGAAANCSSLPEVRGGGFASFRMGPTHKSTGWSATTAPQTASSLTTVQQQRKGHSAAPESNVSSKLHAGTPHTTAAAASSSFGAVSGVPTRNHATAGGAPSPPSEGPSSAKGAPGMQRQAEASARSTAGPAASSPQNRLSLGGPQNTNGGVIDLGGGLTWKPRRTYTREEELSRNVKSLLNKLTIEKFSVISEKIAKVLEGSLKNNAEVQLIVDTVVDKAVSEPDWSEMYADLCQVLQWRSVSPEGEPETIRKTPFMLALLNSIQTEFDAMPTVLKQELSGEGEERQLEEARVKRRVLGVVKLIGELVQRKLLGFKVVNDVVVELVMKSEEPDEHLVECFLQLIATVGYFIDQNPKMRIVLDSWFGRLRELQNKSCYSNRLKFVIQDTIDMRRAEWRKKIHKERAKALDDLHHQLETEEVLGGAVHAAQYGNIVVVGERTNLMTWLIISSFVLYDIQRKKQHLPPFVRQGLRCLYTPTSARHLFITGTEALGAPLGGPYGGPQGNPFWGAPRGGPQGDEAPLLNKGALDDLVELACNRQPCSSSLSPANVITQQQQAARLCGRTAVVLLSSVL
ncbi:hypothetical protein Emed_006579 [Eimeria media]